MIISLFACTAFGQKSESVKSVPFKTMALETAGLQEDFPAMTLDQQGTPWVVYIAYDGTSDVLRIARVFEGKLEPLGDLSQPGIIHHPSITTGKYGALHVFWSQSSAPGLWTLHHRIIANGKITKKTRTVSKGATFAHAATSPSGLIWVTWQSFRKGPSSIFTKSFDPEKESWSEEIKVSENPSNNWAPRIAFAGNKPNAYIAYDSTKDHNFDIILATVSPGGDISRQAIAETSSYEARVSLTSSPDGSTLWLAWERGFDRWGGDRRSHNVEVGLNANKRIDVVKYDVTSKKITRLPILRPVISPLAKSGKLSLNIPEILTDHKGVPWLMVRYTNRSGVWRIGLTRYNTQQNKWAKAITLPNSSFGQERPSGGRADTQGNLWLVHSSDLRKNKAAGISGIYLNKLSVDHAMPLSESTDNWTPYNLPPRNDPAKDTPKRERTNRHVWTLNGKTYTLFFGDFHRHTSVSNCRTATDGSVVEQYRYAIGTDALDYLGPSDHTDIGKPYDPYEWWENQKLADLFHIPGYFSSFYVYEREQRWPWGHRNVVFADRDGPIIYINRDRYKKSPWQEKYPVKDGPKEITPMELWELLEQTQKNVVVISHTGATGMGTNWDAYKQPIDGTLESVVEIYQSARVSYEGINLPQPTVGLRMDAKVYNRDDHRPARQETNFKMYKPGVYQNALKNGHRLGVFASSDHISTHTAFGGVYAEEFTRESILEAISARRTIGATDKIFAHFTCNNEPMGSALDCEGLPKFEISIEGTAPLKRVTLVRNETNYQVFEPGKVVWNTTYTDSKPLAGMNRYYLRIEQEDGNMAWVSPVWVNTKP